MNLAKSKWLLLAIPLVIPVILVTFQRQADLFLQPPNLSKVIDIAAASTFEIRCDGEDSGTGWAVQLGDESFIVTAAHVVEDCSTGEFVGARNANRGLFPLRLVEYKADYWEGGSTDLALLHSNEKLAGFKFQEEQAEIGQWVMALGYPLSELEGPLISLSEGRISAIDDLGHIVTSAPINGGNSGSPLLNSRGQIIGTIYASDPHDEYDNLAYAQPLAEHCGLVSACSDSRVLYRLSETD